MSGINMELVRPFIAARWRDLRKSTTWFLFVALLLSGWHVVRLSYGDVRDYYSYQGSEGPLAAILGADSKLAPGPAINSILPGQVFGFTSTLCLDRGVTGTLRLAFVRLASAGRDEETVFRREGTFAPEDRRCGPRFLTVAAAPDLAPGSYEVRSSLHLREGTWWPLSAPLDTISVRVLPVLPPEP